MRLIDRRDTPLVAALLVGTVVMFYQPLRFLLTVAEDLSTTYHIDLVPGLFVFVIVLTVHYRTRQRDTALKLHMAAREAEHATRHVDRMTELVLASRAFANALDLEALRREVLRHVPAIIEQRLFCLGLTRGDRWEWLFEPTDDAGEALVTAARTLLETKDPHGDYGQWRLLVLDSGGRRFGVLAVRREGESLTIDDGRLEAVAAVLAVSLKNVELFEELKLSSISDRLTGCCNQAHAFAALNAELRRAKRSRAPLAVVMLDIDGFKQVNDEHGHLYGDRLLAAIGATLRKTLRISDVKSRYGGDEFLAILPDTPPEAADHVATHLRRAIEGIELTGRQGNILCRISMGVASATPGELDALALVHRADEELYRDKVRNRGPRLASAASDSKEYRETTAPRAPKVETVMAAPSFPVTPLAT